jgi:hypothetical protein
VPDELLTPANALETTSFNSALIVGPALAGTLAAAFDPAVSLLVEAALALLALARAWPARWRPDSGRPRRSCWRPACSWRARP